MLSGFPSLFQESLYFVDLSALPFPVQNRVAIRADRPQIFNGIYEVFLADSGQWPNVVDVDKAFGFGAIHLAEAHAADATGGAVGLDAPTASLRALRPVGVDRDLLASPFVE